MATYDVRGNERTDRLSIKAFVESCRLRDSYEFCFSTRTASRAKDESKDK
jgi:hypothetical protein